MIDTPAGERASRPLTLAASGAAVFLAAHLATAFAPSWWGLDALRDASAAARATFAAAAVALTLPFVSGQILAVTSGLPDPWASRPRLAILSGGLAVVAVAAFAARPSAIHLLGDGQVQLHDLERLAGPGAAGGRLTWAGENAPLCTWLRVASFAALHAHGVGAELTLRASSVAAGAAFAGLAPSAAAVLAGGTAARSLALGLLVSGGFVQLFCGYIETYPPLFPVLLLYVTLGARAARRRDGPWLPAVVLGVLLSMHFSTVTLVPSLVVLAARRRSEAPEAHGSIVLRAAGAAATSGIVAALLLAAIRFDPVAYGGAPRTALVPWSGELGFRDNSHLLSAAHLADVLNETLLVAPAVVLALPVLVLAARRGSHVPGNFLGTSAAVPWLFTFFANPEVGAFRDWDVFAYPGVLALAWVASRLAGPGSADAPLPVTRAAFDRIGAVLVGASALHTAAWIGLNADAPRAEARFERLLETCTISRHARSYGWESLASLRRSRDENESAAEAYVRAAEIANGNPRLWDAAAQTLLRVGRTEEARGAWRRALEVAPRDPDATFGIGVLAFRAGDYAEAERSFRAAIESRPGFSLAHYNLGLALLRAGRREDAVASLADAVRSQPDFALGWETLGSTLRSLGREDAARACFQRALELKRAP